MAEERTYQGHVYRRNSPGEAWVIAGPAKSSGGSIIVDPYKQNAERRADEDQGFQREQLRIQQQNANISAQNATIAAERAAREGKTSDARGGVETTESERTAAFLATRVAGGIQDLAGIGNIGAPTLKDALVGGTLLGNYTTDADRQRAINAQRDILDAALTLGTGAAYTQEQIDSYRASYFAQPGDAPETVRDKATRLNRLLEASRLKAGASAGMIDDALSRTITPPPSGADPASLPPEMQAEHQAWLNQNKRGFDSGAYVQFRKALDAKYGFGSAPDDALRAWADQARDAKQTGRGVAPHIPTPGSPEDDSYQNSYLGQGMSGANEGLASTLGLPVDLATMGLNLIPKGINAIANTDIPEIERPFLGSEMIGDKFRDWGMIYDPTDDPGKQFTRRVGQSVGGSAIPVGAAANTGRQTVAGLLAATGGGVGAATAQQVAPGNMGAEIAGELLGGGLAGAGLTGLARRQAQHEIEAAIPTVPQLKEKAGELYRKAEATGTVADPQLTQDLSDTIRQLLRDDGKVSPTGRINATYPKASEAVQLVDDYAGMPMKPRQMQTVRSVMAEGMTSPDANERRIARLLVDSFDDWSSPLAPELAQARDVSSRYLNAEKLGTARELAGADASQFSGSGYENALRTRYRQLDRAAIQGRGRYSEDVLAALQNVSRGTPGSNAARAVGRLAPTTPWNIAFGTAGPAAAATAIGGPIAGVATGTATTALGIGGRALATQMGIRNADIAELVARNGGAIEQAPLISPETERLIAAILAGQSSNYLEDEQPANR